MFSNLRARRWTLLLAIPTLLAGGWCLTRPGRPEVTRRPVPVEATLSFGGVPAKITALPTGTIVIKSCHHTGCLPESAPYLSRFAAILADLGWAEPMPVWTYLVQHPEGTFLIDAGATPRYRDPEAWSFDPISRRLMHSFIGLDVLPEETVTARLGALGLTPAEVRAVVLTHQHVDHVGAVPDFPLADIWTSAAEDAAAGQIGASHPLWRDASTRIRYLDQEGSPSETGLGTSTFLTRDRRIEVIATPGHTPGSLTVRLAADDGDLWLIGDTAFTAAGMDPIAPTAGLHTDMAATRALQLRLQGLARPERVFPSHDWDVPARLTALTRR